MLCFFFILFFIYIRNPWCNTFHCYTQYIDKVQKSNSQCIYSWWRSARKNHR